MNIEDRLKAIVEGIPESNSYREIDEDGIQRWFHKETNKLHRDDDQPAIIWPNGDQHWYRNGQIHRDNDLPAIIYSNGRQEWYQNGVRIRWTFKIDYIL